MRRLLAILVVTRRGASSSCRSVSSCFGATGGRLTASCSASRRDGLRRVRDRGLWLDRVIASGGRIDALEPLGARARGAGELGPTDLAAGRLPRSRATATAARRPTRPSRRWSASRAGWWTTGWSGGASGLRKGAMRYATMLTMAERATGLVRPDVERAVEAALRTLAERISRGEAEDIAAFLPPEVRAWLTSAPEPAEGFDRREFIRRVAEREGVDPATAEEHVRGIFEVLGLAVAPGSCATWRPSSRATSRTCSRPRTSARACGDPRRHRRPRRGAAGGGPLDGASTRLGRPCRCWACASRPARWRTSNRNCRASCATRSSAAWPSAGPRGR